MQSELNSMRNRYPIRQQSATVAESASILKFFIHNVVVLNFLLTCNGNIGSPVNWYSFLV